MHEAWQVHGALARGAFAIVVLVSVAVLFAPAGDVPAAPPGVDKAVHLAVFVALAVSGRWAGVRAVPLGTLLTGYAALSEVVQALSPLGRSGSLGDLAADLVGVALGLVAWTVGRRSAVRRRS